LLLGRHLLSTVWLYAKDPAVTAKFYRERLGLPQIGAEEDAAFHFDAGSIRLSIHPQDPKRPPTGNDGFLVFLVEREIERTYDELEQKGLKFAGPIQNEAYGRTAEFRDPDNRSLYLWEPPSPASPKFESVAELVEHYERVRNHLRVSEIQRSTN
jgi:catechol 2,3-dioxygenase-like lactoylglutathione lyase family enzyme